MVRRLTFLILWCAVPAALAAAGQRFAADLHESAWEVHSSRLECVLAQEVPHYGTARFAREAGGELGFELEAIRAPVAAGPATLYAAPPPWLHQGGLRELAEVAQRRGRTPFRLQQALARRMLAELEDGFFPTLRYRGDDVGPVVVALSAVNSKKPISGFLDCLAQVLPYGYDDVNGSRVLFGFNRSDLDGVAEGRLQRVAEYVKLDESVEQVRLDAHTDNVGRERYNRGLAKRRAEAARDFLVAEGVAEERIALAGHGEADPVATNETEEGRRRNRRVVVTLVK